MTEEFDVWLEEELRRVYRPVGNLAIPRLLLVALPVRAWLGRAILVGVTALTLGLLSSGVMAGMAGRPGPAGWGRLLAGVVTQMTKGGQPAPGAPGPPSPGPSRPAWTPVSATRSASGPIPTSAPSASPAPSPAAASPTPEPGPPGKPHGNGGGNGHGPAKSPHPGATGSPSPDSESDPETPEAEVGVKKRQSPG